MSVSHTHPHGMTFEVYNFGMTSDLTASRPFDQAVTVIDGARPPPPPTADNPPHTHTHLNLVHECEPHTSAWNDLCGVEFRAHI